MLLPSPVRRLLLLKQDELRILCSASSTPGRAVSIPAAHIQPYSDSFPPRSPPPLPQGFKLPFDRHDWIVDRCGQDVRYIIDFYSGAPQPGVPASMHLDVRPALDSIGALYDRLKMQTRWVASGRWQHE